ncbi:hypothetical protein BJ742DRAFT_804468 [Cladochytrium replicatum]|nr:hypothetical protein BJ742DRAFT_804468 [Cladochytrium replicatum]
MSNTVNVTLTRLYAPLIPPSFQPAGYVKLNDPVSPSHSANGDPNLNEPHPLDAPIPMESTATLIGDEFTVRGNKFSKFEALEVGEEVAQWRYRPRIMNVWVIVAVVVTGACLVLLMGLAVALSTSKDSEADDLWKGLTGFIPGGSDGDMPGSDD